MHLKKSLRKPRINQYIFLVGVHCKMENFSTPTTTPTTTTTTAVLRPVCRPELILKCIFKKQDVKMEAEINWLKTGPNGGC
jgi:hypothetical protein